MSETPVSNSPNSSLDPGWQLVAQEMHTYHPALREHAARNLAERGIEISPEHVGNKDLSLQQRFELAVDEIKTGSAPEQAYTFETAEQEKPFTHYTNPGNIFQILRFGLQSGNFKNRIDTLRRTDPTLDEVAKQMSGLRHKKGGSYQGADSISLGLYSNSTVRNKDLVLLIDPNAKVFGLDPNHRTKSGYGHGIDPGEVAGGFDMGNPTAYQDEVLAANTVPPSEIKGVIINERTSILSSLGRITREYVVLYQQTKKRDPQATKENLLANSRLIASLSGERDAEAKIEDVSSQIDAMQTNDIITSINVLQRDLLQGFVGRDQELNESTLRDAIQSRFGIKLLTSNQFTEAG